MIAYQHTSHGTHVSRGVFGLQDYKTGDNQLFGVSLSPSGGLLEFRDYALEDYAPSGVDGSDLSLDETAFIQTTRNYLDAAENSTVNVIMWSWCDISGHDVAGNYLPGMTTLISEYGTGGSKIGTGEGQREVPVNFIFMTGHANEDKNTGALNPKEQSVTITNYCVTNKQFCLDYYTIDTHDMDDNYYEDSGDDGNSSTYGGNFYTDWQDSHTLGEHYFQNKRTPEGYVDFGEHNTQHITANRKAYAMWWILARMAGWEGGIQVNNIQISSDGDTTEVITGGELQFSAKVFPEDASNQAVDWSIINGTGSATISSEGMLRAVLPGDIKVVALAMDGSGVGDTLSLTIKQAEVPVTGLELVSEGDVSEVDEGDTVQFTVLVLPSNATNQAVFWSVNMGTGKAHITQNGLLSAETAGSVDVIASALDGSGISSSFSLNIRAPGGLSDDRKNNTIVIYPNPSQGKFYLDARSSSVEKLKVISADGSVVLEINSELGGQVIELDLQGQQPGVFFIHTLSKEQSSLLRIIITR